MPHAIRIHATGGPEVLTWEDITVGDPGPGEARVTISRSGDVTRTELKAHNVNDRVAYAVIRAAREWTFEPAGVDGPDDRHVLLRFHLKRADEGESTGGN